MKSYTYHIRTKFCLRGEHLDPEEINQKLLVRPTRSFKKGDVVFSGTGEKHARKIGLWSLGEKGDSKTTDMVSEHLLRIISQLKRWNPEMIKECQIEDPFLDIYIAVKCPDVYSGTCDFLLNPSDLQAVSNLYVPLKITVDMVQDD